MTLEELRAAAEPGDASDVGVTVRVDMDTPPQVALRTVFEAFGTDDTRDAVRVVIGGEIAGVLHRDAALDLMPIGVRGVGDAAAATLPGFPLHGVWIELRCPVVGCPTGVIYSVTYDPAAPDTCDLHPDQPLEVVQ